MYSLYRAKISKFFQVRRAQKVPQFIHRGELKSFRTYTWGGFLYVPLLIYRGKVGIFKSPISTVYSRNVEESREQTPYKCLRNVDVVGRLQVLCIALRTDISVTNEVVKLVNQKD